MLVRGRPGDTPSRPSTTSSRPSPGSSATSQREAVHEHGGQNGASSWSDTPAAALEEDYRRTARKARKVMDHLFYG